MYFIYGIYACVIFYFLFNEKYRNLFINKIKIQQLNGLYDNNEAKTKTDNVQRNIYTEFNIHDIFIVFYYICLRHVYFITF